MIRTADEVEGGYLDEKAETVLHCEVIVLQGGEEESENDGQTGYLADTRSEEIWLTEEVLRRSA